MSNERKDKKKQKIIYHTSGVFNHSDRRFDDLYDLSDSSDSLGRVHFGQIV